MTELERTAALERTALEFSQKELRDLVGQLSEISKLSPRQQLLLFFIFAAAQDNVSRLLRPRNDDQLRLLVTLERGINEAFVADTHEPDNNHVITARVGPHRIGSMPHV